MTRFVDLILLFILPEPETGILQISYLKRSEGELGMVYYRYLLVRNNLK